MIEERLAATLAALQAGMPSRLVSRSYQQQSQHSDADLRKGVVTLLAAGAREFNEPLQRELGEATIGAALVGYLLTGEPDQSKQGLAVEQAELTLFAEIQDAILNATTLCGLDIVDMNQSRQLEAPYGWIVVNLSWREV